MCYNLCDSQKSIKRTSKLDPSSPYISFRISDFSQFGFFGKILDYLSCLFPMDKPGRVEKLVQYRAQWRYPLWFFLIRIFLKLTAVFYLFEISISSAQLFVNSRYETLWLLLLLACGFFVVLSLYGRSCLTWWVHSGSIYFSGYPDCSISKRPRTDGYFPKVWFGKGS